MKKMTTLCLALALTCATEAGATTDKQPKLKGRQTAAWGVAVPGSRTQSASAMRFLNMGLGAPMAAPRAVGNDPVSSITTPGFGWADGPDGNQWYYTQNYKLDGYFSRAPPSPSTTTTTSKWDSLTSTCLTRYR